MTPAERDAVLLAPPAYSASGLRDRAILQLLAYGYTPTEVAALDGGNVGFLPNGKVSVWRQSVFQPPDIVPMSVGEAIRVYLTARHDLAGDSVLTWRVLFPVMNSPRCQAGGQDMRMQPREVSRLAIRYIARALQQPGRNLRPTDLALTEAVYSVTESDLARLSSYGRHLILSMMRQYSENEWAAGWHCWLEYLVWRMIDQENMTDIANFVAGGDSFFYPGTGQVFTPEGWLRLVRDAGGWWARDPANKLEGVQWYTLAEWLPMYRAWQEERNTARLQAADGGGPR